MTKSKEPNSRILEKIKKCLALSQSSNPNEAEAALRQARKMMEQHNLELSDVEASRASEARVDAGAGTRVPPVWMCRLASVCAEVFSCDVVLVGSKYNGREIRFIGVGSAPTLTTYAYDVLSRQLKKARREYVASQKRCSLPTKRRRGDAFANAWIDAVAYKVTQFAGMNEGTSMAIQAYKARNYPEMAEINVKRRKTEPQDVSAIVAGWEEGQSAQLHKGMGTNAQPLAIEGRP